MDEKTLHGKDLLPLVLIRIIVSLFRFMFDIPKFISFLIHGTIPQEGYRRK